MGADAYETGEGPWNPGIDSTLPRHLLPLASIHNPANVATPPEQALELADFCGLPAHRLVAFRARRLLEHELLIRVTADFEIPDGPAYEDLGLEFRRIAGIILTIYLLPEQAVIERTLTETRAEATSAISAEVVRLLEPEPSPAPPAVPPASLLARLFRQAPVASRLPAETIEQRQQRVLADWQARADAMEDALDGACCAALLELVTAIRNRRGRIVGSAALLTGIAATLVCNRIGSRRIGALIEPLVRRAAAMEGFRLLPAQEHPVVMNVKGASAAGKSSMRPLQRRLAARIDVPWDEFARISPDIWRKFLLDYASLGPAYKYAGMMTAQEVEVIDRKLDRYMAEKAARGAMTHLLIDRFRFDSFAPDSAGDEPTPLLTRFGSLVYMFFMITPPEATVERAWWRGLKVGRYKAVDDLLAHNVEAYTGMPQLFFKWARRTDKRVHCEFLDNTVPYGQPPRTIAFGWNGDMVILDVRRMIDIDRFRKVDINARAPGDVLVGEATKAERNVAFLVQCARTLPAIRLAEPDTGRVYAKRAGGTWQITDEAALARAIGDPEVRAGLAAIGLGPEGLAGLPCGAPETLRPQAAHTLGVWGQDCDAEAIRRAAAPAVADHPD
jgi:hypothetical protein